MAMPGRARAAGVTAALFLLLLASVAAADSVSIGVNTPSLSLGLHVGETPQMAPVHGLPVYHAPAVDHNYFFYGGHYYLFHQGVWFSSPRHNGPWSSLVIHQVPRPVLAVPVTYYKIPPGHAKKMRGGDEHGKWNDDRDRGDRDRDRHHKPKHKKWKDR